MFAPNCINTLSIFVQINLRYCLAQTKKCLLSDSSGRTLERNQIRKLWELSSKNDQDKALFALKKIPNDPSSEWRPDQEEIQIYWTTRSDRDNI